VTWSCCDIELFCSGMCGAVEAADLVTVTLAAARCTASSNKNVEFKGLKLSLNPKWNDDSIPWRHG